MDKEQPVTTPQADALSGRRDLILQYARFIESEDFVPGASVYKHKLASPKYDKVPHTIYYYYLRVEADGRLIVWHYFHQAVNQIEYVALEAAVQDVAQRALAGTLPKEGENFELVEWKHKSYIVFVIDEEHWDYPQTRDAIFIDGPNHTFFDAKNFSVTITDPQTGAPRQRPAVAMINHMKENDQGGDLPLGKRQPFKFSVVFNVRFTNRPSGGMIVIFDPDGTNVGPPLPPPPPG